MTLDFNDDRTYTKDVVLKNVRYALFDPKSLQDDAFFAKFLDLSLIHIFLVRRLSLSIELVLHWMCPRIVPR